jgi:hypothetical protein
MADFNCPSCGGVYSITVRFKDVYGNRLVYPVCKHAKAFAEIAGTKTLTDHMLKIVKGMGIDIELEQETL